MKLDSIVGLNKDVLPGRTTNRAQGEVHKSFANVLKASINNVNDLQIQSDVKTEALAQGKISDLHDVMITAQKASITLEAAVQIQRKVIDAYNEVMRMQV